MAVWRMRIGCWITKATNTHSEYVIIIAFPLQQLLLGLVSMLRHTSLPVLYLCSAVDFPVQHVEIISNFLYSINRLIFVTERECVECAGGPEWSTIIQVIVFP